ncbi:Ferroporti-1 [Naviculisporaceae sp. PSN 640]
MALAMIASDIATDPQAGSEQEDQDIPPTSYVHQELSSRLYTSHFLSTWNSRLFEFGSVLFLASIFPHTLQPMSIYALVRCAAAILFSQPVGHLIDRGNRLTVVRLSILGQRIAVICSCVCFLIMLQRNAHGGEALHDLVQSGIFAITIIAACVEKLASIMNLVSVERDWVVVIAGEDDTVRREMNAKMRRIDLLCKLLGPLAISTVAIISTSVAIWVTLATNLAAVGVEYAFIARVYNMVPGLRRRRQREAPDNVEDADAAESQLLSSESPREEGSAASITTSLPFYFRHPAFLPSFSLALLYLTVLSFSGQMVTYLISVGYTPFHVGLARTLSTIFELSATWVAPLLVRRIGDIRGGIWSLSWQIVWLTGGVVWLFAPSFAPGLELSNLIPATGLVVGVALSRVGLWGYDLCAQNIIQEEVEPSYRGTFSAVETSFQNFFELISYITTIIFWRPDQFQWPVIISIMAVYISGGLYAKFVRERRGHLFHAPSSQCFCVKKEAETS